MADPLLKTTNLTKKFGDFAALFDVSIEISGDENTYSLIGPNGAGKTTFFNVLTGVMKPTEGNIYYQGQDITDLDSFEIVRLGLSRSYQVPNIFIGVSILENVRSAILTHRQNNSMWDSPTSSKSLNTAAIELIDRVGIDADLEATPDELSHGDRKRLDLAVALVSNPDLLLLDEPTAGLGPTESEEIISIVRKISAEEDTVLFIIEHDMDLVFEFSDEIVVLHQGEVIAQGPPTQVRDSETVRNVYLGRQ